MSSLARPSVSVVLVARRNADQVEAAVAAVLPPCRELQVQLVVVRAANGDAAPGRWPGVTVIDGPAEAGPGELRALALERADGDVVVFADAAQACGQDWNHILLHRTGLVATDGPTILPASEGNSA